MVLVWILFISFFFFASCDFLKNYYFFNIYIFVYLNRGVWFLFVFHSFLSKNVVFFYFCCIFKMFHFENISFFSVFGYLDFEFEFEFFPLQLASSFCWVSCCIPSMYRCTIGCKCMVIILMFLLYVFLLYIVILFCFFTIIIYKLALNSCWYCNWLLVAVVMSAIASIPLNFQGS